MASSWVPVSGYPTELRNGTLNNRTVNAPAPGTTTFTLARPALIGLVTGALDLTAAITDATDTVEGDPTDLQRLVDLPPVDPDFAIVTPLTIAAQACVNHTLSLSLNGSQPRLTTKRSRTVPLTIPVPSRSSSPDRRSCR